MPSLLPILIIISFSLSLTHPRGLGFGLLSPDFYDNSCPQLHHIVASVLRNAISKDPRMPASILRLHFHDCFVQGCDASVLLADSPTIRSEKGGIPNKNSLRGFEVVDEMKSKLEELCPDTVSCADIIALAARASIVLSGGPNWELALGRRDSRTSDLSGANKNIPPPNSTLQNLITLFSRQGLDHADLVALSGGHTIGMARCVSFKQRLYNKNNNKSKIENKNTKVERGYLSSLRSICPPNGGDNNISPLDFASPASFDNAYFKLILFGKGLLASDQVLLTGNHDRIATLVKTYADDESVFFKQFAKSMIKMSNLKPLTGFKGHVRKNCRLPN